jgi:hypothetical protein
MKQYIADVKSKLIKGFSKLGQEDFLLFLSLSASNICAFD